MNEYIERAAAMESILGLTIVDPAVAQYANAVCYHLQNLPAADVAPVRHGRWKLVGADKRGRGGNWECTGRDGCGKSYPYRCDYCPNCGALMKEADHEAG